MSATSVDPQRTKGQDNKVQNGSLHQKDAVHDNDFEPYLSGQSNPSNSYPSMSDPYLSSYYPPSIGFPYSLSEAPWSTAGDPPIPYLTTYGQLSNGDHHFMHDAVFGQPGGLGNNIYQHRFNFFLKTLHSQHGGQVVLRGSRLRAQPMGAVTLTHQAPLVAQLLMGRQVFTVTPSTRPLG